MIACFSFQRDMSYMRHFNDLIQSLAPNALISYENSSDIWLYGLENGEIEELVFTLQLAQIPFHYGVGYTKEDVYHQIKCLLISED